MLSSGGGWTDSNGNQKSWSTLGSYPWLQTDLNVDTLGRAAFTTQQTLDAQQHPVKTVSPVHDLSGTARTYTVNWQSVNYATSFANTTGYGPEHELTTAWYVISSIQLPNGRSYTFHYDTVGYGEITEIDLPEGGVITYTYANAQNQRLTRRYVAQPNGNGQRSRAPPGPSRLFRRMRSPPITIITLRPSLIPAVGSPRVKPVCFHLGRGGITDAKIYSGTARGTPIREYKMAYTEDNDASADDACYDASGNLPPERVKPSANDCPVSPRF